MKKKIINLLKVLLLLLILLFAGYFIYTPKAKMKHNINPTDMKDCFIKIHVESNKYSNYRSKAEYKTYRIHKDDLSLLNKIINKNKKKQ